MPEHNTEFRSRFSRVHHLAFWARTFRRFYGRWWLAAGFGFQTWIGGEAINTLLAAVRPGWDHPWLCFFLFWLLNLAVILRGIETIRYLQGVTAPALLVLGLAMLG